MAVAHVGDTMMTSTPPTCLFNRPHTTSAMNWRSRRLSEA